MDKVQRYAPMFYRDISIFYRTIALIGCIISVLFLFLESAVSFFAGILLTALVMLAVYINFVVASWFYSMAVDKGYTDVKYIRILFYAPMIGQLLVLAMPDLRLHNDFPGEFNDIYDFDGDNERTIDDLLAPQMDAWSNDWQCACGKVNPNFLNVCSCGRPKRRNK